MINLIGKKVVHSRYGSGMVTDFDGKSLQVKFANEEKKFRYPQAFEHFLAAEDPAATQLIAEDRAQLNKEKERLATREKGISAIAEIMEERKQQRIKDSEHQAALAARHSRPRIYHVAVRCPYCDGGAEENGIGFSGICSEANIMRNIIERKEPFCSYGMCACKQYFLGKKSREAAARETGDCDGIRCFESRLLHMWEMGLGGVTQNRYKPTITLSEYVRSNSLCILTTRLPDMEADCIFGLFLVDNIHKGDQYSGTSISTQLPYRLILPETLARQLPLTDFTEKLEWKYKRFCYLHKDAGTAVLKRVCELLGQDGASAAFLAHYLFLEEMYT